jgi:hypothetical protein
MSLKSCPSSASVPSMRCSSLCLARTVPRTEFAWPDLLDRSCPLVSLWSLWSNLTAVRGDLQQS